MFSRECAPNPLKGIIARTKSKSAHAYDILVRNGLEWVNVGIELIEDKKIFLMDLKKLIKDGTYTHTSDGYLANLEDYVQRALLKLAIIK